MTRYKLVTLVMALSRQEGKALLESNLSLARTIGVNNYATNYTYDALENTYKVTGYSNGRTNSAYNENGSLAGTENGNGNKSFYQYDDAGRLKNLRLFTIQKINTNPQF